MSEKQTLQKDVLADEKIIDLYWERDEKAIGETDKKYGKYLFTIAYNIVHDRLDCEECLNDTYLGTWNRIPPTRPNVFRSFLSKIMRNIAIDRFRKNTAAKKVPSELVCSLEELDECITDGMSVGEEYEIREMVRVLNDYLRELPDRSEFIFVCRYYFADYIKKIAEMLKISEDTVYRELSEMRKELKARLEKEGFGDDAKG